MTELDFKYCTFECMCTFWDLFCEWHWLWHFTSIRWPLNRSATLNKKVVPNHVWFLYCGIQSGYGWDNKAVHVGFSSMKCSGRKDSETSDHRELAIMRTSYFWWQIDKAGTVSRRLHCNIITATRIGRICACYSGETRLSKLYFGQSEAIAPSQAESIIP